MNKVNLGFSYHWMDVIDNYYEFKCLLEKYCIMKIWFGIFVLLRRKMVLPLAELVIRPN